VLSQFLEDSYVFDLVADGAQGIGYLLKEKVGDMGMFADTVRRVAGGESVLDPDVVAQRGAASAFRDTTTVRARAITCAWSPTSAPGRAALGGLAGGPGYRPGSARARPAAPGATVKATDATEEMTQVSLVTDTGGSVARSLIPARLDRLPWTRFHTRLIMALGTAWILDGLEITLAGAVAGVLTDADTLHMSSAAVGAVATVYLIGEVAGALFVRTFLSFSLETEIEGVAPWRRALMGGVGTIRRAAASALEPETPP